jgi:hypothetical protein
MDEVQAEEMERHPEGAARQVRSLVPEAQRRGSSTVSASAMQARLFQIYDDIADSPEVLALVQAQLTLTLGRTLFSAEQVEALADSIDWHLGLVVPAEAHVELVGGGA